jgi:hypothetical protein
MIKKLNSLTILFLITVIMVVLMLITIQRPTNDNDDEGLLFPDLFGELSQVDMLKFKSSQDEFTLFRKGEDWFVKERLNYPADFDLVKRALIDISDTKVLERKTDDPKFYPLLGVASADEGGEALTLTMLSGDKTIAGLVLGNERETTAKMGAKQFYVRRQGEPRAWLAEGYLNINPLMLNWIKTEVIDIARERIATVNIIQPSGETATLINLGAKDKFGTPESRDKTVFKYEQLGYDIAGTLFQLRMEDVQTAKGFSRGDAEVVTAEFITFDGLKVITKTSFNDGAYLTTFHAEFDSSAIKDAPTDIQQLNVLKTPEQVQAEVADINSKLSDWVYRFGGFVGTNMMRAKADMVTEAEKVIPMPPDVMGFGS